MHPAKFYYPECVQGIFSEVHLSSMLGSQIRPLPSRVCGRFFILDYH
jgi:hypothetical protein